MTTNEKDEEDIITSKCYIIYCYANNGAFYPDRVYLTKELAKKRADYLNEVSKDRVVWYIFASEIGK